jgi:hypothetical protein
MKMEMRDMLEFLAKHLYLRSVALEQRADIIEIKQ